MTEPVTRGVHHIGMTVSGLEESAAFFVSLFGWKEVKRKEDYPAIFVSDGSIMLTLWKNREEPASPFNKDKNIGLHHVAFLVPDEQSLLEIYERLKNNNIKMEFTPELVGQGPARHMMCFEPSGNRIEFIWPGA